MNLNYADEIVLINEGIDEMPIVLVCFFNFYFLCPKKRGKMLIISIYIKIREIAYYKCLIDRNFVNQVEKFKYLGTILTKNGSLKEEF